MVKLDAVMREAIIKKYAELTGRSIEEARAILEPLFEDEENELIDLLYKITQIVGDGEGVAKDVAEAVKANMLLHLQQRATTKPNLLDKIQEYALVMQMMDKLLGAKKEEQRPDPYVQIMEQRMQNLENTLKQLMELMVKQQQSSEKNELIKTLKMMQETMQKQIDTLREELKRIKERDIVITSDTIPKIKEQLEALGFELKRAGSDFDVEQAKKFLEKLGYEIKPGWVSADELTKILEKERERVRQEIREKILQEIETKKVETAEKIVTTAIDKLFDLFSPVVPEVIRSIIGPTEEKPNTTNVSTQEAMSSAVDEFLKEKKGEKSGRRKNKRKGS